MIRQSGIAFGEIDPKWGQKLYQGFLRKIENMDFETALDELPQVLLDEYKRIYPERCPVEKKEPAAAIQPDLPAFNIQSLPRKLKCNRQPKKKRIIETDQPNLFQ